MFTQEEAMRLSMHDPTRANLAMENVTDTDQIGGAGAPDYAAAMADDSATS